MELKIFSKNYYLKLPRLLQSKKSLINLGLFLIVVLVSSCSAKEDNPILERPKNLEIEVNEFHENGKPKSQELYYLMNGVKTIYGYEELYPSGEKKITGLYNEAHKRDGLWKSFYETGTPWSTGGYSSGIENGEKKVWYPNGELRYEGEMKEGKPSGRWIFWDEKGVKTTKVYE